MQIDEAPAGGVTPRLVGVDLARGLALLAMMAVHLLPPVASDGDVSWAYRLACGRASALFAVLAGLSLVLAHGPREGNGLEPGTRHAVIARAAFVAGIGLVLAMLKSGIALILVHYGTLFAIGTLFLGMRARPLLVTGGAWMALTPVAGHILRPHLPDGPGRSPSVLSLGEPLELVSSVVLTGYYPVLQWTGYLIVGMGVGRLPLRQRRTTLGLLAVGVVVAVGAKLLSSVLLGPAGGLRELSVPPTSALAGDDLTTLLQTGLSGTTPSTSWWWLAVSAPHSGTPLDLLHTTGTALAMIGGCLLLAAAIRGRWALLPLPVSAVGTMTLTLYTAHVLALAAVRDTPIDPAVGSPMTYYAVNVVVALLFASAWQLTGIRGPLEEAAATLSSLARPERPH